MKTVEERAQERAQEEAARARTHAEQCAALYESSKDVPVYQPDPNIRSATDYAQVRTDMRELLRAAFEPPKINPDAPGVVGSGIFVGGWGGARPVELHRVACNHCRTQLLNPAPGVVLTSSPPQYRAACPGCGWIGSIPTF